MAESDAGACADVASTGESPLVLTRLEKACPRCRTKRGPDGAGLDKATSDGTVGDDRGGGSLVYA